MLQLKKSFHFVVFLPGFIFIFLLSGCMNSFESGFVTKNKVVLAEQHPNTHFDQEVMVVRISQVLLIGRQLSRAERANLHF